MKVKLYTAILILLTVATSCCHRMKKSSTDMLNKSSKQVALTASFSPSLLKTHWSLAGIKGVNVQNPASGLSETYIVFLPDSSSLTGSGGCNSLFGTYHLRGDNGILLEQIGSTKMFCDNMDNEMKMLSTLRDVNSWEIRADTLILKKGGKTEVLSFVAKGDSAVEK
jgi:heat shock protein HslJ